MSFDLPSLRSMFQPSRRTNIDNMFEDFFNKFEHQTPQSLLSKREQGFYPQLDISETNSNYFLELDLPGVNKKDVSIKVDNNILTIKGKKELNKERKDNNFYTRERFYGDFQRSLSLPAGVDTDAIDADFKDGVLLIKISKVNTTNSKIIDIKS